MPSFPSISLLEHEHDALQPRGFTAADAWTLGSRLRTLLLTSFPTTPVAIRITLSSGEILFSTYTTGPTCADTESWLTRKTNTVFRWGTSTIYQGQKLREAGLQGKVLSEKYAGVDDKEFCCHGGGFPIRVRGVEGVVAAVVVSGLHQGADHGFVVAGVRAWIEDEENRAAGTT